MHIEVDQSGKIGDTAVPTVLALSNDMSSTLWISAAAKRECVRQLRQRGKGPALFYMELFAAALFLLLRSHLNRLDLVVIDVEYPGHEATIRGLLLNRIWRIRPDFPKETNTFGHIGKKSRAHAKALAVYRRREPPDLRVSARALLALLKQK